MATLLNEKALTYYLMPEYSKKNKSISFLLYKRIKFVQHGWGRQKGRGDITAIFYTSKKKERGHGKKINTYPAFSRYKTKILLLHDQSNDPDTCLALPCNDEFQALLAIQISTCDLV